MWADAVFEGGGVKGIGLVGALCVAEEKGYRWKKVAGSSAGSIIAALLAAGYTAKEMYEMLIQQNFLDFIVPAWYDKFPYLGPAIRLWIKKGMYSGLPLERWIEGLLQAKGVRTFADLKGDVELRIIASDISRGQLLVLPYDLEGYGYNPEQLPVARVVRMSCSIPFFFDPVKIIHRPSKTLSYIVDGGVLSNFPVWLFDQENPRWPTFGFRFISRSEQQVHQIHGPLSMFLSILYTMMDAHDNRDITEQDQVRTIRVPTLDVKLTDFSISLEKRKQLFQSGVKAADEFFDKWTFDDYLAARGKRTNISYNIRGSKELGG
ncbi:patatin-like phospholipase family protein [Paenactinomyces guangxiensis]|uniref:Patatin-like phospholipase family protein n=1 Tax=Paenactinomyces guangxiensis TaxID=1490290 RepID=A0A7W2A7W2_9BACL|nr:patatin-like phospholipase family protein [Paenactinomyces guangxiensis]MBA4494956.1 patatin-like phospholipase family protein [Paenactinomyces guangxiensis]MBH8592039.1 patatin-like phospholipase family protein [Paenactinomyces guangxiensis]